MNDIMITRTTTLVITDEIINCALDVIVDEIDNGWVCEPLYDLIDCAFENNASEADVQAWVEALSPEAAKEIKDRMRVEFYARALRQAREDWKWAWKEG